MLDAKGSSCCDGRAGPLSVMLGSMELRKALLLEVEPPEVADVVDVGRLYRSGTMLDGVKPKLLGVSLAAEIGVTLALDD